MFFNQKKYGEEAEKKRKKSEKAKEPSFTKLVILGLLATFPPTRWLLRLHRRKINDSSITQDTDIEQTPIIYVHGFRGGDYTTNALIEQTCKDKKNDDYLKITIDLFGNIDLEGTWTKDNHPLVQLVYKQKIVGIYAGSYLLRMALRFLKKRYNFQQYDAVAHSLGAPVVIKTEMRTSLNKKYPRLDKGALIAGPFDGVMYLGDVPNLNQLNEKGKPFLVSPSYIGMMLHRGRINPETAILNIYGNVYDETNTDRFISVVSAKSIRYILAPIVKEFKEFEIRGEMAEHSMLHDNLIVIKTINAFLDLLPE